MDDNGTNPENDCTEDEQKCCEDDKDRQRLRYSLLSERRDGGLKKKRDNEGNDERRKNPSNEVKEIQQRSDDADPNCYPPTFRHCSFTDSNSLVRSEFSGKAHKSGRWSGSIKTARPQKGARSLKTLG